MFSHPPSVSHPPWSRLHHLAKMQIGTLANVLNMTLVLIHQAGPFSWPETPASKMKEGAKSGGKYKIQKTCDFMLRSNSLDETQDWLKSHRSFKWSYVTKDKCFVLTSSFQNHLIQNENNFFFFCLSWNIPGSEPMMPHFNLWFDSSLACGTPNLQIWTF